jgi:hypothetical protein
MDTFLTRPTRSLLEEEQPVYQAIMNDQNKSVTNTYWGPSFFNQMDMDQSTITQNASDRYILQARWAYAYRLDLQNPTNLTWLDVDDIGLKLVNILSGTPAERTDMQVKAIYTVDGVDYLPVGCTSFSQEEYVEPIRL